MSKPKTCKACNYEFYIEQAYIKEWYDALMFCPNCFETFCVMKPETERILQRKQYMYLGCLNKKLKENYFKDMYNILVSYTQSLILKKFSKMLYSPETLEEKAFDALHLILEKYAEDEHYKIHTSFGGYLNDKINEVFLHKRFYTPKNISLNFKFEDGNEIEYEDEKNLLKDIEKNQDKRLLAKYITNLIFNYEKECEDKRENFLRLLAVNYFLNFGENKVDKFFRTYGRYGKSKYEETIMLIKHELRRLYKENSRD